MRDEILANWDDLFKVKTPPIPDSPEPEVVEIESETVESDSTDDDLIEFSLEI